MEALPYAKGFGDLFAYQQARALAKELFEISKRFPREEAYALTDQIRRASRSIGAQIAEAWAKRRYERHFVSKLTDADGEQQETQHWLEIASDCGYLSQEELNSLRDRCQRIGKLIGGMIDKADLFCGDSKAFLREPEPQYDVNGNL